MLTHYGDQLATFMNGKLVYKDIPRAIARRVENNTGVRIIACLNGMNIGLKDNINVELNKKYFLSWRYQYSNPY